MNLRYKDGRWEAEFTSDFNGDLQAVKGAGFRADTSSGAWVWWTAKLPVLGKLRKNRPASGLTITPEGLEAFQKLVEIEERAAPIRAAALKLRKEQKKEAAANEAPPGPGMKMCAEGYMCVSAEDLPPKSSLVSTFVRPEPPSARCFVCGDPLYFYELPDLCLFCEENA